MWLHRTLLSLLGSLSYAALRLKRGLKHKRTCSLTPAKGKTGEGGEHSPRRGNEFRAANLLKGAIPTAPWETKASHLHRTALRGGHRGLDALRRVRAGTGTKAVTRPEYRGSRWPGASSRQKAAKGWGKALPCLQGGRAGGLGSSVSPLRCGDRGPHPPYRVAPLSGQPKEHSGKGPTAAKTQPCTQGGRPVQSKPWHLEGALDTP